MITNISKEQTEVKKKSNAKLFTIADMTNEHKKEAVKLVICAAILIILGIYAHFSGDYKLLNIASIAIYIINGLKLFKLAFLGLIHFQPLDEHFLMTIASIAAIYIGQYPEAASLVLFWSFGELFEDIATHKSRKNIEGLLDIVPDVANRIDENGNVTEVDLDEIEIGDIMLVRDGEKVGVDGKVIEGHASLDTSSITGESMPVEVAEGDEVISSSIVNEGFIKIEASKEFDDSVAAKIIELIEDSTDSKSESEKRISKFARIYTPIVVAIAVIMVLIPIIGSGRDFNNYLLRAATFLVISCPCAFVISVPLSFISGLGVASENGILIKGSQYFEGLSEAKVLLTDKTGTLTTGEFIVEDIEFLTDYDEDKALDYLYNIELMSTHPIAQGVVASLDRAENRDLFKDTSNEKGLGVRAITQMDEEIKVGSAKFTGYTGDDVDKRVFMSIDDKLVAIVHIGDEIKENSFETIENLHHDFNQIAIVSGDNEKNVAETAAELKLDDYYAGVMPEDKLNIMKDYQSKGNKVVFVGDGMNDAPVLKNADVGISMGETASDIAIEASDILVVNGEFSKLIQLMSIVNLTNKTVNQNIIFIIAVKIAILALGIFGYASMWLAIFGDVGVSIITILWSMRLLRKDF